MKAFLIDLDGVLYVGKKPVAGARECLDLMESRGYGYRFVSNSTRRRRSSVAARLNEMGYEISEERIFTPPLAAIEHMRRSGRERCFLLAAGDVHRDFEDAGITIAEKDVDYVVVGDAGERFTFENLNMALRLILEGAEIMALERDRYWMQSDGLVLSTGPFVAALEYATGKRAELMGKPARDFFGLALRDLGVKPEDAAMIGDDILTDVQGAQQMGMKGFLVKTGKYRKDAVAGSGVTPDLVLDSLATLAERL
ncbi:MAG: putative HAD-hydrolase [Methanosaeta sp. PtaU1.Bin060]|jgi:HAD superfamily hydrolase (TIGR01458 family)|nr:MAG: putative HAD-hydrolase [Methanosaeta sp. PtaU1.Bin060]